MCGINAIFDPERTLPDRAATVARMNGEMAYRGPDGEGSFSDGPVTIGMRRLSIIDLESGDQPLFNEDRSLALVCNGEIYNHVELREALRAKGHTFATGSDCETILHLYEEHGERCVEHLRGMFAFALWDAKQKRLVAARDRLGIKPLYVARRGRRLGLSSELKTLVKAGLAGSALDRAALYRTLRHTYPIDERRTLAAEVDRVPPGTIIVADASGVREHRYWTPTFGGGDASLSDDDLRATLEEAVRIHLRSDVPLAVLLSAGLDSATMAALAARAGGEVSAICAGYVGDHACDEREGAHATARALGVRCLDVEMDAGEFASLFDDLTARCDEPPCDVASMAQWALYRACRGLGFKVVLSGIGGDEIFFGYPTWNRTGEQLARRARMQRAVPSLLQAGAQRVEGLVPEVAQSFGPAWPGTWTGVGSMNQRPLRWLGADGRGLSSAAADGMVLDLEKRAEPGPDAIYAFLAGAYLPNNGFQLADKLGMGNSVEVRVPLADHVLFERVAGLPLARRFVHGESKPLFKRLIRPYLPAEVLTRPKQGFAPPGTFVRTVVERHAEAILDDGDLRGWLDTERLRTLLSAYLADPVAAGAPPPRLSKLDRVAQRGRLLVNGGFFPGEAGWMLFSLAAFVRCRQGWR